MTRYRSDIVVTAACRHSPRVSLSQFANLAQHIISCRIRGRILLGAKIVPHIPSGSDTLVKTPSPLLFLFFLCWDHLEAFDVSLLPVPMVRRSRPEAERTVMALKLFEVEPHAQH